MIKPNWPAPSNVQAYTSTRQGGFSAQPFNSFNLGMHVEDNSLHVQKNRELLRQKLQLPNEPCWIQQVHGTTILEVTAANTSINQTADAAFSQTPSCVCAVLTADCLPILLCDYAGTTVAAIHAGWRGLAAGIIENCLQTLPSPAENFMAWLGPAISKKHFEVGSEVRDIFLADAKQEEDKEAIIQAFFASKPGHYYADLYHLARLRLENLGISSIYGGEYCTYEEEDSFYSYRRDGQTGRMASLIWLETHDTQKIV